MHDDGPKKPPFSATAPLLRPLLQTISALSRVIDGRAAFTVGHQSRVSSLARAIARALNLTPDVIEAIRIAGTLHDLGMSTVPASILAKPEPLVAAERAAIERHVAVSMDVLDGIAFPVPVATAVRQHHERLDGSGYPERLKGDAIGIEARILAVADVFESLCSARPYRPALDTEAALAELTRGAGTRYDPAAVTACAAVVRDGHAIIGGEAIA